MSKTDDFLIHHGIKGMRWGVRKNRKNSSDSSSSSKTSAESEDHKEYSSLRSRPVKTLSNAELKKLNERMQLEQNYNTLMNKPQPSSIDKGHKKVKNILDYAKTANEIYTLVNSPAAKAAKVAIGVSSKKK